MADNNLEHSEDLAHHRDVNRDAKGEIILQHVVRRDHVEDAICEFVEEHPRIVNDELKSKVYEMATNAVTLEDKFIKLAFAGKDQEGITEKEVKQYIRHIADRRLLQLGMKPKFGVKENPMPWLDWVLNGASHDNFFEKRVTEYSVNGMEGDWGWDANASEGEVCGVDGNGCPA